MSEQYRRFPQGHKHEGRLMQRKVSCAGCGADFWQLAFSTKYLDEISDLVRKGILRDAQVESDGTVWHLRACMSCMRGEFISGAEGARA